MEITSEELKTKIDQGETILVDFWAPWCGPCRALKPTFEKLSVSLNESNEPIKLYTFDVEKNKEFALNLGIRAVPTIKGFSNGNEIYTQTGVQSESQLNDIVKQLIHG